MVHFVCIYSDILWRIYRKRSNSVVILSGRLEGNFNYNWFCFFMFSETSTVNYLFFFFFHFQKRPFFSSVIYSTLSHILCDFLYNYGLQQKNNSTGKDILVFNGTIS